MLRMVTCLSLALIAVLGSSLDALAQQRQMAHMVFFTMADQSDDAKQQLAIACEKYLSGHDGTVYFSVGIRAKEMQRDVNDQEFDVSLHLVFKDKQAYDQYSKHPRHLKFIEENSQLWSSVRVFDSFITAAHQAAETGRVLSRKKLQLKGAAPKKLQAPSKLPTPKALPAPKKPD